MGPAPVELVREVAAAGEVMPPKSTYFFPKVLTGLRLQPAGLRLIAWAPCAQPPASSRTSATTSRSARHTLTADEPKDHGGERHGPSPQELLAASLASCTAITMEMYAKRKGWDVAGLRVDCEYTPGRARLPDDVRDGDQMPGAPHRRAGRAPAW